MHAVRPLLHRHSSSIYTLYHPLKAGQNVLLIAVVRLGRGCVDIQQHILLLNLLPGQLGVLRARSILRGSYVGRDLDQTMILEIFMQHNAADLCTESKHGQTPVHVYGKRIQMRTAAHTTVMAITYLGAESSVDSRGK